MIRRIAVVIPAADEQDGIADCLTAIRLARQHLHQAGTHPVAVHIVVVLDRCRDGTAAIVRRFTDVQAVRISTRCIGAARQVGARIALAAAGQSDGLWLANTDADSRVPPTWLSHLTREARSGAELVLGTVQPGAGLPATVHSAWTERHRTRDGHRHVHGANLAIRADAHVRLGGWRPLRTGEDVDLANRAAHLRVSRTAAVPVVTSTRSHGRAPHGFSSYLRALR